MNLYKFYEGESYYTYVVAKTLGDALKAWRQDGVLDDDAYPESAECLTTMDDKLIIDSE